MGNVIPVTICGYNQPIISVAIPGVGVKWIRGVFSTASVRRAQKGHQERILQRIIHGVSVVVYSDILYTSFPQQLWLRRSPSLDDCSLFLDCHAL